MSNRQTPHAKDVAARLLGACLQPGDDGTDAAYEMDDLLEYNQFFDGKHKRVACAIMRILDRGDPLDQVTATQELRQMGELDGIGGPTYVTDLSISGGLTSNARKYALIVREEALKREMIRDFKGGISRAYDQQTDALELLEDVQSSVLEIGDDMSGSEGQMDETVDQRVRQHIKTTQQRRSGENPVNGIRTGWPEIDDYLTGLKGDQFIVVAARPSMGKTAWGVGLVENAALNGVKSAIFSLEMSQKQYADRMIQSHARIDMQKVRQGYASDAELKKMHQASQRIKQMPIRVVDDPDLTISSFKAKARRLVKTEDVELIVVDYLQLFQSSGKQDNRQTEVAKISRSMKKTAKKLSVPVVALAQVNRKPMSRGGGKRPQVSDLRESGAIEQDADVIAFIHRLERIEGLNKHDKLGIGVEGIADFMIEKQRDGPVGTVYLKFIKENARFESVDLEAEYDEVDQPYAKSFGDGSVASQTIPAWAQSALSPEQEAENPGGDGEAEDPPEQVSLDEDSTLPI